MQAEVLVLGANGQLGSDLVKSLAQNELSYIGLERNDFDCVNDDIYYLDNYTVKYLVNCIAVTNVDGCEDDSFKAFQINTDFVYRLAKYCDAKEIVLLHISTDYVFDGKKNLPYTELDRSLPLNIYGISKYAGELAVANYHRAFFIFRISSLFGLMGASGKGGSNFISTMLTLGRECARVDVIADQFTCPTSSLAVARVILFFIQHRIKQYGVYHCVSSNGCSRYEFTQEIFRLAGLDTTKLRKIEFANYLTKTKRPQYTVLAIDKLKQYITMPTWQDSLQEYFDLI